MQVTDFMGPILRPVDDDKYLGIERLVCLSRTQRYLILLGREKVMYKVSIHDSERTVVIPYSPLSD